MNKTSWIVFSVITVGILASLAIFASSKRLDVSEIDTNTVQVASDQNGEIGDHVFGNSNSKVTIISYGDFQCPPCGNMHSVIRPVLDEYQDRIQYIFRNFPITTLHPNARAAAAVAEAAGLQGKYWDMHNLLYDSQSSWSNLSGSARTERFEGYAMQIGLDINKFINDLSDEDISSSLTAKINYDYAIGQKAGVDATPTLYLNGVKMDGTTLSSADSIKAAIDSELAKYSD